MNHLGRFLNGDLDPALHAIFVYNANPLATLPNQELLRRGLEREDLFVVVHEQVMTDTARYADLLLPATTFLEHDDLARGYGAKVVQEVRPATSRRGEAKPNLELFRELTERFGLDRAGDPIAAQEWSSQILSDSAQDALRRDGIATAESGARPIQFVDVFPEFDDHKAHLCPTELDDETPAGLYRFQDDPATSEHPFALISPATHRTISSSLGESVEKPAALEMHPDDCSGAALDDGQIVEVFNDLGTVRCRLRVTASVRRGTVVLHKGLWSHQTLSGTTSNALAPDTLADLGGGACFNDARVGVAAPST